jgi:dCTP diphosphatase
MRSKKAIDQLQKKVIDFRDKRNWRQFHTPKNLASALSIEAAELQELFLWKTDAEIKTFLSEKGQSKVQEELADICIFLLYLAEACGVDLSEAVRKKVDINELKYPVHKAKNSAKKYNEL